MQHLLENYCKKQTVAILEYFDKESLLEMNQSTPSSILNMQDKQDSWDYAIEQHAPILSDLKVRNDVNISRVHVLEAFTRNPRSSSVYYLV